MPPPNLSSRLPPVSVCAACSAVTVTFIKKGEERGTGSARPCPPPHPPPRHPRERDAPWPPCCSRSGWAGATLAARAEAPEVRSPAPHAQGPPARAATPPGPRRPSVSTSVVCAVVYTAPPLPATPPQHQCQQHQRRQQRWEAFSSLGKLHWAICMLALALKHENPCLWNSY